MPKVKINSWTDSSIGSVYSPFCFQVCGLLFWSFPYYSYFLAETIPNHFYGLTGQPDHFHYHFHSFDVHVLLHWYAECAQVNPEKYLIDFNSQDFLILFSVIDKISTQSVHADNFFSRFCIRCLIELKFCEVSRNSFSNRCWKFQLSILKNKKVLFLKNKFLSRC